ncbi:hypothetical protein [Actinomycetospora lemnae]|uniref:Uncharacterized protein n=1 Tax=Actinomycetospora lemnae TaxID=3019891 RepID=A0ABT5SZT2_9PSEU|nr:hypothetical protein [Actinomycetospora sp. DW7H6]MDD7968367.1 hypothetical protein [Actinomycetospora sp. DW7H6]
MDIGPVRRRLTAEPISSPVPGESSTEGADDAVAAPVPAAPDDTAPQPAR